MIVYNFNVEDPDELSEIIHKLSLDIAEMQDRIKSLENMMECNNDVEE